MNKLFRYFLIALAVGIIAALLVYKYVYNKPHTDYAKAKPEAVLSAEALFAAYTTSKDDADSLYTGRIIQVDGILSAIEDSDSLVVVSFVFNEGMFGDEGIRCSMMESEFEAARTLSPGDATVIKGYCEGYNMTDVLLGHSSIINK